MTSEQATVVIADDQPLVRQGLRVIVDSADGLTVVAEAENGEDAIRVVREHRPSVVLMDIRMPVMDGLEASRVICGDPALSDSRVMIVTTFDDDDNILEALRVGVGGFIGKDAPPDKVVSAVRTLHAGVGLVFPDATRALIASGVSRSTPQANNAAVEALAQLTERERDVVGLIGRGLTNDELAAELFISKATVKTHINRTFAKLHVRDRAQLVILAYEAGLQIPGEGPTALD